MVYCADKHNQVSNNDNINLNRDLFNTDNSCKLAIIKVFHVVKDIETVLIILPLMPFLFLVRTPGYLYLLSLFLPILLLIKLTGPLINEEGLIDQLIANLARCVQSG